MDNQTGGTVESPTTEAVLSAADATTETAQNQNPIPSDSQVDLKTEDSSKTPPLNEHPRFKEVIAEKNQWKQKYEEAIAKQNQETKVDFSDDGEAFYATFKERFLKELSEMAEVKNQEQTKAQEEVKKKAEEFRGKFDGGVIPESFKIFATDRLKVYKNATLDELYADWQEANPQISKVSGVTSSGSTSSPNVRVNRKEDFVTTARKAVGV